MGGKNSCVLVPKHNPYSGWLSGGKFPIGYAIAFVFEFINNVLSDAFPMHYLLLNGFSANNFCIPASGYMCLDGLTNIYVGIYPLMWDLF